MKRNNKKGFTIVELVIVIAVIAILAGVLIPTFAGVVRKAQENAALQEVKSAYTATLAKDLSTDVTTDDVVNGKKIYVVVNEEDTDEDNHIYITVVNGQAKVVAAKPTELDYVKMVIDDDTGNGDKVLKEATPVTPAETTTP